VPAHATGFSINMQPWERCFNFLVPSMQQLALQPSLERLNQLRATRKLGPLQAHSELWQRHLMLADTAFGLEYARPLLPTLELTGPLASRLVPFTPEQLGKKAPDRVQQVCPPGRYARQAISIDKWLNTNEWLDASQQGQGTKYDQPAVFVSGLDKLPEPIQKAIEQTLVKNKLRYIWVSRGKGGAGAKIKKSAKGHKHLDANAPNFAQCFGGFMAHTGALALLCLLRLLAVLSLAARCSLAPAAPLPPAPSLTTFLLVQRSPWWWRTATWRPRPRRCAPASR